MLTQSSLGLYRACPRRFKWRYVEGWRDTTPSADLEIGTLVHLGLECFWSGMNWRETKVKLLDEADSFFSSMQGKIHLVQCLAYVRGYYAAYDMSEWETLGVEESFDVEIGGLKFAGKMDARARRKSDGKQFLIEHKTAKNPSDDYFKKLASAMNTQLVLYREAVRIVTGEDCGILYDVIKKQTSGPTYRMEDGKIPRPRRRKTESEEDFDQRKLLLMETIEEYADRLMASRTHTSEGYIRKIITSTTDEHQEALKDLIFVGSQVEESRKQNRYPRNAGNCYSYGRMCEYFNICSGVDTVETSAHLEQVQDLHPELQQEKEQKDEPF